MSLAEFIDMDEFLENRVLTLKYISPVCPRCHRECPQGERHYINVYGSCENCVSRRKGENP